MSMRKWLAMVLLLSGCDELADQQSEGLALATLSGTLSLGQDVAPPASNLRISVLWQDPALGSLHEPGIIITRGQQTLDTPAKCADGQPTGWRFETGLLEQPGRLSTAFPSGFSVQLSEPPPLAALFEYPDGSGVSVAHGDLVVYEDRNGNHKLDPSTFNAMSPDKIFGSSLGPTPWGIGQRRQYSIVYLTRDIAPGTGDGDGQAGYSLVTSEYGFLGFGSLPSSAQRLSDATIDLTLVPTTYAQQLTCAVMCKVNDVDLIADGDTFLGGDLGVQIPSELGPGSKVWSRQDGDASTLTLVTCTKQSTSGGEGYLTELSVVKMRGCTESTSILITGADEPQPPCTEYVDVSSRLPVDPPM